MPSLQSWSPLLLTLVVAGASACTIQAGTASDFDALKVTHGIGFDAGGSGSTGGSSTVGGDGTPGPDATDGATDEDSGSADDTPASPGSIVALQLQAEDAGCDPSGIKSIASGASVSGVVVTSQEFSASSTGLKGYYAMDAAGGPWSGLLLVFDSAADVALGPGDVIDATGTLEEAWCGTQLGVDSWTLQGQTTPPAAEALNALEVEDWEAWENVVVELKGVAVLEHYAGNPNKGQYLLDGGLYANFDFAFGTDWFLTLDVGATYDLTGPLRYSFDAFRLNPRNQEDVVLLGGGGDTGGDTGADTPPPELTTIAGIQSSEASTACDGSEIETIASGLTVEGMITVAGHQVDADLIAYALSDATGGPYSGVEVVVNIEHADPWPLGQVLQVTGSHTEFYCLTQFQADSVVLSDTQMAQPQITLVEDLMADPEPWEGVIIEVHDVTVTDTSEWSSFGQAVTDKGFLVDRSILGSGFPAPEAGTTWSVLRGLVTYGFDAYRVAPRTADDLIEAQPDDDSGG